MKIKYLSLVIVLFLLSGCAHPFRNRVEALLKETGAAYTLKGCSDCGLNRKMHCELSIPLSELDKFVRGLGLDQPLAFSRDEKRVIIVADDQNPCSSSLRSRYGSSFGAQQWVPTRHGFASAILFYNKKTQQGCLFLSIAYG